MSRTSPTTLASDILAMIMVDAAIASYITTKFGSGKVLKTYLGIDTEDQPESTNYPILAIQIGSYVLTSDRSQRSVSLAFAITIEKLGETVSGNKTALDGLSALEGLFFEVERVIEAFIKNRYSYQYAADWGESRTEIAYPLYRISFEITFQGDI